MNDRTRSLLLNLSSMLIFGTIGLVRRGLPLSSTFLACFRGIVGSLCLAAFVKLRGKRLFYPLPGKKRFFIVLAGLLIGLNWIFLFEAYNHTSIATATLCYYMAPVMMVLLSLLFLHERVTLKKALCGLISVVGIVLVNGLSVFSEGGQLSGVLFGLAAALMYALAVILTKQVPEADAFDKTVTSLFSAGILLVPYLLATEGIPTLNLSGREWLLLIVLGVVHTGIAYALYFGSQRALPVQTLAILSYADPVSALILSALVLGESMSVTAVIGAVLILGSAMVSEIGGEKTKK